MEIVLKKRTWSVSGGIPGLIKGEIGGEKIMKPIEADNPPKATRKTEKEPQEPKSLRVSQTDEHLKK